MTLYYSRETELSYTLLDENGKRFGRLFRYALRSVWMYVPAPVHHEIGEEIGKTRTLYRSLKKSLKEIDPTAKWMEQLTMQEVQ